ncbi:MAG: SDR family oxidoreductase [Dehalococcoidia bacterium]|nr:SDR family oxidoreductase [Dehalococcoidia bacterium]
MTSRSYLVVTDNFEFVEYFSQYFEQTESNIIFCVPENNKSQVLGSHNEGYNFYHCDFLNSKSIQESISAILNGGNHIDCLINFINNNELDYFNVDLDDWLQYWNYKVLGSMRFMREIAQEMMKNGQGSIINILDIQSRFPNLENVVNLSADTAILNLTKATAAEFIENNIQCNSISLGNFNFNLLNENSLKDMPINDSGNPKELMSLIDFLANENNRYIIGENINIDGGFSRTL